MASNINPYQIDGTYPIAGQDNDSQGFRDNFTNLRTNLTFAKEELEDLQTKAVLKTALTGSTLDNTFVNVLFTGVKMKAFTEVQYDFGLTGATIDLQFTNGQCQTIQTDAATTVGFSSWPAAGMQAKIRLWVDVLNVSHTLTLPATVTIGKEEIRGLSTLTITFPAIGVYIFEFSTYDGGTNVAIEEITRKLVQPIRINAGAPSVTGASGDKAGMLVYASGYLYVCIADYDGITSIWKKTAIA